VNELFGEQDAAGLGHRDGGGAEVLNEQAAEMALADAEAVGEGFDAGAGPIEYSICDEREGAGDGVGGAAPGGEIGRGFGTAAEAGTEASFLGGGGRAEKFAIREVGGAGGANRAAIDAGGFDAYEQKAVKPGVAALESAVTGLLVRELHGHIFAVSEWRHSRFSDIEVKRLLGPRMNTDAHR
jgi:hypothetical protein